MRATLRRRLLADAALLGITFVWGSTFVVVKKALESSSTLLFLFLRFTLGSAVLTLLFRRRLWVGLQERGSLLQGLLVGLVLFLGYLFQTLGLRLTTPARSGFLTGLSVVAVPVLQSALYRSLPGWNCWVGVGCATAGLYCLAAPETTGSISRGDLLTLICAVAFGLHILLLGRFSRSERVATLAVTQIAVAALLSLACLPWAERLYVRWNLFLLLAVLVTGLLATALGFWVQTWAQQFTSPTHTALILSLEPLVAWMTSYLALGERLGARGAWGAGLILAGIFLSEWKPGGNADHPSG